MEVLLGPVIATGRDGDGTCRVVQDAMPDEVSTQRLLPCDSLSHVRARCPVQEAILPGTDSNLLLGLSVNVSRSQWRSTKNLNSEQSVFAWCRILFRWNLWAI